MFKEKVHDFFWEDVEQDHLEKVKTMKEDKDYNEGMRQLVAMREQDIEEQKVKKMDAQTRVGIGQIIVSGASIVASVFLGMFAYHQDDEMKMSNGKTWNIGTRLLNKK